MSEQLKLSTEVIQAIALWLGLHGYTEESATITRQALTQCLIELGMIRGVARRMFRNIKRTKTPETFPLVECAKWAMVIIFACNFNPDWFSTARAWVERNREALIASGIVE